VDPRVSVARRRHPEGLPKAYNTCAHAHTPKVYHAKERAVDLEAALAHAQGQLIQAQAGEAQALQALQTRVESQALAEREAAEAKDGATRMYKQVGGWMGRGGASGSRWGFLSSPSREGRLPDFIQLWVPRASFTVV